MAKVFDHMSTGKGRGKKALSLPAGGKAELYSTHRRDFGNTLTKLHSCYSFDPAIPLRGIYLKINWQELYVNIHKAAHSAIHLVKENNVSVQALCLICK